MRPTREWAVWPLKRRVRRVSTASRRKQGGQSAGASGDGADEALEDGSCCTRAEVDGDAGFCAGGGQEAAGAAEQGGFAVGEQVAGDVGVGGDAGAFVDERVELGRGHVDEASEHEFFFGAEEGSEPGDEVDDAGIEEGVAHFAAGAEEHGAHDVAAGEAVAEVDKIDAVERIGLIRGGHAFGQGAQGGEGVFAGEGFVAGVQDAGRFLRRAGRAGPRGL